MDLEKLQNVANELRIDIVRMIARAGSGHPGGSLSSADIMCALYFGGVLHYDPIDPNLADRDRFILAKGHAAPALYATLARAGFFPRKELVTLRQFGSRLQGHPDSNLLAGVEVSTGSLGQGLSVGCGVACGVKLQQGTAHTFVLLGDGECQEGQVWEAAMFAAHNKLDNLVAIIDRNCLQIDGNTAEVCDPGDIAKKFEAFGWKAFEVDGHDLKALIDVLNQAKELQCGQPKAIIAHTVKGKGVSFMENQAGWHGKAPNADELAVALEDLNAPEADAFWSEEVKIDPSALSDSTEKGSENSHRAGSIQNDSNMASAEAFLLDPESKEAQTKRATRAAYGVTLAELARKGVPIVAVDADLTGSTTTKSFAAADPAFNERLFNAGIAEQNMTGVAAGLSLVGNVAFTGSFAVFGTGRAYDQIRNTVCYSNLNVKIAPTHAGVSVGPDGGSHQMLEDISLMCGLPHMRVLVPADYASAVASIKLAAQTPGPFYIRMGRESVPCLYQEGVELALGGSFVLREGTDATIIACGLEVVEALKAADTLAAEGISVDVIDAYSVKPLDTQTILASAAKTGCVVTAEEHSVVGGLGCVVCEVLAEQGPVPVEFIGMRDRFGKSGSYSELSAFFGLNDAAIVEAVKRAMARK